MKRLLTGLMAALVILSCGQSYEETKRLSREQRRKQAREDSAALKIAVMPTLDCLPIYVAKERQLFDTDVDIRLKPLYRFVAVESSDKVNYALQRKYEHPLVDHFLEGLSVPVTVSNDPAYISGSDAAFRMAPSAEIQEIEGSARREFLLALKDMVLKRYNGALGHYDKAVSSGEDEGFGSLYRAFYLMNRGVLRAEMIEFIASMESNVQTLTMDERGNTRARVRDQVSNTYDYSESISDMEAAASLLGNVAFIHYDLANLYVLSSQLVRAIESYDRAIALYPYMGDAYFNRGLVLIYLKDKEKGCIDLSRAGELGVGDSYNVISRYCAEEREP